MDESNVDWKNAAMELSKRIAKIEYLTDKGKDYRTYIPNGPETMDIMVKASAIFSDVVKRNGHNIF